MSNVLRMIDWKMSLGNLITICTVIAGIVAGWARIEAANTRNLEQIVRLEKVDEAMKLEIREVREKADAKLEVMARDMGEVKASLRAISTNIEWIVRQSGKDARAPP